jgi:branched-chain amino acid aminotransferase
LSLLKVGTPKLFTIEVVKQKILNLSKRNACENIERIKLSVFRGNGSLYEEDRKLQYIIKCRLLDESVNKLNENGWVIDVYAGARKSCDTFSNLKSANFLPYTMALMYAQENKLNDA